jgi:hypothetical protein
MRATMGLPGLMTAAAAIALGGCGSSVRTDADPATLVPSSAPLYVSVALKPEGGTGGDAMGAARKLTHLSDPFASLAQSLLSVQGSHPQWARDLKPWVGKWAGVFFDSADALRAGRAASANPVQAALEALSAGAFASGAAQGAIVLDTSDPARAQSFLNTQAEALHARAASFRGVSYRVSPSGLAEGVVKRFAILGSRAGFQAVVQTAQGSPALSSAAGYEKPAPRAIVTAFARPEALGGAMRGPGGRVGALGGPGGALGGLFAGAQSAALSVIPSSSSLTAQVDVRHRPGAAPLFGQGGAQALGGLPGTAWLAAGVGDAGASLPRALALARAAVRLGAPGSPGVGTALGSLGTTLEALTARLASHADALAREFAPWAGPGGVFVSGTGLFSLQAALVIASKNPHASRAQVGRLARLLAQGGGRASSVAIPGTDAAASVRLPGFPAVLYIADGAGLHGTAGAGLSGTDGAGPNGAHSTGLGGRSKLVVGLGQTSVLGALRAPNTLLSSPSYSAAATALGGGLRPSLILEFPALVGLLEAIGLTQSPPLSELVPYLKSLGTLTAGSATQGQTTHLRAVLGLLGGA